MRFPSIVGSIGAMAVAASLACGPKTAPGPSPETTADAESEVDQCYFLPSTASSNDTIVVALFEDVDPSHAPAWRNEAERLVFHHLYDPLELFPPCALSGLARSQFSEDHHTASFMLRDDVRFWDGTRVTSHDVVEVLEKAKEFTDGITSIRAPDDRRIEIDAVGSGFDWPGLQSPALALTKQSAGLWPMGTGPYTIVEDGANGGDIVIRPVSDSRRPVIRFIDARGRDARDVLDSTFRPRVDFTISDDPAVFEYATSQNGFHGTSLRSSRIYFLLSVTRVQGLARGEDVPVLPESISNDIARLALRNATAHPLTTTQGARFSVLGGCDISTEGATMGAASFPQRILYDVSDSNARDLAERLVALATGNAATSAQVIAFNAAVPGIRASEARFVAKGVPASELEVSLAAASDFAYVVGLPCRPERCFLSRELIRLAPWVGMGSPPLYRKAIPLVETIPYVIARKSGRGATFGLNMSLGGDFLIDGTRSREAP
jgi:hypothetical protein